VLYSWTLQSNVYFQTSGVEIYKLVDSCSEPYFAIKIPCMWCNKYSRCWHW